ncbi:hypothetical protein EDD11_010346 [Mortierella claussenii]|nr:hypothetical protein EDD11_010346 [Mortierella claussenii]
MTTAPLLRRETTRTLCDQFTTIFDPAADITSPTPSSSSSSTTTISSSSIDSKADLVVKWIRPSLALPCSVSEHTLAHEHILASSDSWSSLLSTLSAPVSVSVPLALLDSKHNHSTHCHQHPDRDHDHDSPSSLSLPPFCSVAPASFTDSPFSETHPSPASTVVTAFTPASTPCSESDDSLMHDSLSPPSSPWFPSALDLKKCLSESQPSQTVHQSNSKQQQHNFKFQTNSLDSNSDHDSLNSDNNNSSSSDLDFFSNSFYHSLPDFHNVQRASLAAAVRSNKSYNSAQESSRTAAPSDLYNVSIDELLSVNPLNLEEFDLMEDPVSLSTEKTQQSTADAALVAIMVSAVSSATQQQSSEHLANSQTSTCSDDTVTDVLNVHRSVMDDLFDSEGSLSPALDYDDDEHDFDMDKDDNRRNFKHVDHHHVSNSTSGDSAPVRKRIKLQQNFLSASPATSTSRRRSTLKAPRIRKQPAKRPPKVYPPRAPKPSVAALSQGVDRKRSNSSIKSVDRSSLDSVSVVTSPSLPPAISLSALSRKYNPSSSISDDSISTDTISSNAVSEVKAKTISTATVSPTEDGCYRCELCPNERFGRVHDLKRHQISKHNEKTWPCDFCHRPFVRRDALLRHYAVKAARKDGIHPTAEEKHRMSEARARAKLT